MKAELVRQGGKAFGIEITATNKEEEAAIRRFWEGGVKVNAFIRFGEYYSLKLTFADLIEK